MILSGISTQAHKKDCYAFNDCFSVDVLLLVSCCLLLWFLCILETKEKTQSTVQVGHNSGSYTPNMKGCSQREIDVQSIRNNRLHSDC